MFLSNRVCCVSDIHIGVHQNGSMWHNVTLNWARWLAKDLKEKKVKDIMICGDLFHYRDEIAVNTIQIAQEFLNILSDFNIVILSGNHDAYYKDNSNITSLSILKGWPNINVYDRLHTFKQYNKTMMICPWGADKEQFSKCDIMFGHFEISSFKMNHFKTCTSGVSYNELLKKSPLVITGHFHHGERRKYKSGEIVYLGNPFEMDFGDINCNKGYYILDVKTSQMDFYKNNISPKHVKIKLSELAEEKNITNRYKKIINKNIVRVYIDMHIMPDDVELVLRSISKNQPEHLGVEYSINYNDFGLDSSDDHDLSGVDIMTAMKEFVDMLDIENKSDVFNYVNQVYKSVK
ncbi:metallophosphoesterase [bacterium]|nr:metallophosphoesterase [bacterium]